MKNNLLALLTFAGLVLAAPLLQAQSLTVEGDLNVEGDAQIGEAANPGSLLIYGPTGASAGNAVTVQSDGGFVLEGTYGTGTLPSVNSSFNVSAFMWYPAKAALVMGRDNPGFSDDSKIGVSSFAFGLEAKASGEYSLALGAGAWAEGASSIVIGQYSFATGEYAISLGQDVESLVDYSVTIGYNTINYLGPEAISIGANIVPDAMASVSIGNTITSLSEHSVNIGFELSNSSYRSIYLGSYSLSEGSPSVDSWVSSDPLFVIANGQDGANRSNALIMNKNGETLFKGFGPNSGSIVLKPQDGASYIEIDGQRVVTQGVAGEAYLTQDESDARYIASSASGAALANGTSTHNDTLIVGTGNASSAAGQTLLGRHADASATTAFAVGNGSDTNNRSNIMSISSSGSLAIGTEAEANSGIAIGNYSIANGSSVILGNGSETYFNNAIVGSYNTAYSESAVIVGDGNVNWGWSAATVGHGTLNEGESATLIGGYLTNYASRATVVGHANEFDITHDVDLWVEDEPIFVVGNGQDSLNRSNALVMNKNGETLLKGYGPNSGSIVLKPQDGVSYIEVDGMRVVTQGSGQGEGYLTEGQSDARYVAADATELGLAGGTATHTDTIVVGTGNTSSAAGQTVVGRYSDAQAETVFAVGIGTDDAQRVNAISASNSGDLTVQRDTYLGRDLQVERDVLVAGDTTVLGTLKILPRGGLSMGTYTVGGAPSALHVNTTEYLNRLQTQAGQTLSTQAQEKLDELVRYLVDNDLWNETRLLIASSNYNASSGDTVYALGGLPSNEFSKPNTVNWAPGGLVMTSGNGHISASDFLGTRTQQTWIYYGKIYGNTGHSVISDHYTSGGTPGADERSFLYRVEQNNPSDFQILFSELGDTSSSKFDIITLQNAFIDTEQFIACVFNSRHVQAWMDGNKWFDGTLNDPIYSLYDTPRNVVAHHSNASGNFRAFLVSTKAFSESEIAFLRGFLSGLDWQ